MLPMWGHRNIINAQRRPDENHPNQIVAIRRRILRGISNPLEMSDSLFIKYYRMPKHLAVRLIDEIEEPLERRTSTGVPPMLQVLAALRFYAEGSYQKSVGQDFYHPLSQTTVSRILHRVTDSLVALCPKYCKFPTTADKRRETEVGFRRRIGFPGILGAIDCTHIAITRPYVHEETYVNYKGYHSLNVQMICDTKYKIMNIRICLGSTNDRFIWRLSRVKDYMEGLRNNPQVMREEHKYFLIGDGGYTLSSILLIPFRHPNSDSPEAAFTNSLVRTRVIIEQVFGILRQRWRCMKKQRTLHYEPIFAGNVVRACSVLHNFLLSHRYPLPLLENVPQERNHNDFEELNNQMAQPGDYTAGVRERAAICARYFND